MLGKGFLVTLLLGFLTQMVLGRVLSVPATSSRGRQLRSVMWMSLAHLGVDMLGMVIVFFAFLDQWALVGGALGLLTCRAVEVAAQRRTRYRGGEVSGS